MSAAMTDAAKPTKGVWCFCKDPLSYSPSDALVGIVGGKSDQVATCSMCDAPLIAEAGNVFNETGLTPRQLAEKLAASEASDTESLALYRRTRYRADQLAEQQGDLLLELKLLVNAIEAHSPAEAGPPTDDPYIESRLVFARAIIAKVEAKP